MKDHATLTKISSFFEESIKAVLNVRLASRWPDLAAVNLSFPG
jgi:hypothetical protein